MRNTGVQGLQYHSTEHKRSKIDAAVPRQVAPAQPVEMCRTPGEEEEEPGALQIGDTGGIIPQFVVTRRRRDRRADVDIRRAGAVGPATARAAGPIKLVEGENG